MTQFLNCLQNSGNIRNVESTAFPTTKRSASGEETADRSRRRFMKINLYGLALAPAASLLFSESAKAVRNEDGVPALLDANDPQAQALDYTAQGSKGQQSCSNCQLYVYGCRWQELWTLLPIFLSTRYPQRKTAYGQFQRLV